MGLLTATAGTLVGFIFAYAIVRCKFQAAGLSIGLRSFHCFAAFCAGTQYDPIIWPEWIDH